MLKRRYQILLICFAVLAVYYPSIFAEFNSVDDVEIVTGLMNGGDWSFRGVFMPACSGGLYYRPILMLSFIFDRYLWDLGTSFMHLENILLHLTNSLLVYYITSLILPVSGKGKTYLPMLAALCFGLHPIATEPVNWVASRSDVLAGTFVLLSAASLLKYRIDGKKGYIALSILSLLLGALSKEVALAFVPGAFFMLIAHGGGTQREESPRNGRITVIKSAITVLLMALGSTLVFYSLRSFAFASNSPRIGLTLRFMSNDFNQLLFVILRAFGFYMKKIFIPLPLNFAIVEVDPLYELLAMALVLFCLFLVYKRTLVSGAFLAGVFLIAPAIPIAYGQIAWTPYAERYIYIATAFIVISSVLFVGKHAPRAKPVLLWQIGVSGFIVMIALATLSRNTIWKTNLTLYKDTVEKSPEYSKVWNQYGIALLHKKDWKNAEAAFRKAGLLYNFEYDEQSDLNLAYVLRQEGRESEALLLYNKVIGKSKGKSVRGYEQMISFLTTKSMLARNHLESMELTRSMLEYNQKLYALNNDPFILYRMGILANALGDRQKAIYYYGQAGRKLPDGDVKKAHAQNIAARLASE